MAIRVTRFAGMAPKVHPSQLPDGGSVVCHNFIVNSGVLVPFSSEGPFVSLHNEDGTLESGVSSAEVVEIAKPATPTLKSRAWQCRPADGNWLQITLVSFVSWIGVNGDRLTAVHHAVPLGWRGQFTERGMNLFCETTSLSPVTFNYGGPYYFRGPRFMFSFLARPGEYGGPATAENLPTYVLPGSPVYSSNAIPLVNAAQNVYGEFQVVDYSGPVWDEDFMITDYDWYTYFFGDFSCSFRVNLNYTENQRKHYYFVTANLDDEGREGPPSSISNLMLARPGQILTVNTPHAERRVRLYRAGNRQDSSFRLISEGEWTAYEDAPTPPRDDEIPPFGNWTASGSASLEEFLRGSVMHPASFAAAFSGDTVWCSDRYRLHSWPEENAYTFPGETVIALACAGDTIVVFTRGSGVNTGKVHALAGNDPGVLACYELSESTPLLSEAGLVKVGAEVYWPTLDGIAGCNGSKVDIVTKQYWDRRDWMNVEPGVMAVQAEHDVLYAEATFTPAPKPEEGGGDGPIHTRVEPYMLPSFLGNDAPVGGLKFRIDLKEDLAAVTTFTDYTGNGQGTWRSKVWEFPTAVTFDLFRASCSGIATVVATVDGVDQAEVVLTNSNWVAVTWPHGRFWTFTLRSEGTITSLDALDRQVVAGQDVQVFTAESVASFRNIRFTYPEPSELSAAWLSCQDADAVPVRFYAGTETSPFYETTIADGGLVRIPPGDRVRATEFRVEVDTEVRVDQLVVAREVETPAGEAIQESRTGQISPWLTRRYVWASPALLRSVRISAAEPVTLQLFFDDSTTADAEIEIGDAWEHRVVWETTFKRLRYCFVDEDGNAADDRVLAVIVATSQAAEAPADGVHLMNAPAYRSQVYRFRERGRYCAVQVVAETYPLWLDIYAWDERERAAAKVVIRDDRTVALPWEMAEDSPLWEFDLRSTRDGLETRVHSFHLLGKVGVKADGHIRVNHTGGPAPWLVGRYEFDREERLCSRRVETTDGAPIWMELWVDGEVHGDLLECVAGYEEYFEPWPGLVAARTVEFRFYTAASGRVPADERVQSVSLYVLRAAPVQGPVVLGDWPFLSREYTFVHAGRFTAAQVVLRDGYEGLETYLRVRCGVEEQRVLLTGPGVFALPSMGVGTQWDVCVENAVGIKQVVLYPEETVKVEGGGIEAHAMPGAPDWLRARYEWNEPTLLSGVRVESTEYPVTLEATTDQGVMTVVVADDSWTPTGWTARITRAVFRFAEAKDGVVRCMRLLPQQEVLVGADGIVHLGALPFYWDIRVRFVDSGAWAGVSVDADAASTLSLAKVDGTYTAGATIEANDPGLHRVKSGETLEHALTDPTYGSLWTLDVTCTGKVFSVLLVAWQPRDVGPVVEVSTGPGIPDWYRTRYRFDKERVPRSVWVRGESELDLYCGGHKETFSHGETERYISTKHESTELVFDFEEIVESAGALVSCEERIAVTGPGVSIRQSDGVRAWRNKVLEFPEKGAWAGVSVDADAAATVTLERVSGGYTATASIGANDARLVRVKSSGETLDEALTDPSYGSLWYLDITCSGTIHGVFLLAWQSAPAGPVVDVSTGPGIPAWFHTRYVFEKPRVPRSVWMRGQSAVAIYYGAGKETIQPVAIEQRIVERHEATSLLFNFGDVVSGDGALVACEEHVPVPSWGVVIRQADQTPVWRNKVLRLNEPGVFSVIRCRHGSTVKLRPYGAVDWTSVVMDSDYTVVSTGMTAGSEWELDVEHTEDVVEVALFTRSEQPIQEGLAVWRRSQDPVCWLDKRVICARPTTLSCARVTATGETTFYLRDKDRTVLYSRVVAAGTRAFRLPRLDPRREWVVDVVAGADVEVEEAAVSTSMGRL